MTDQHQPPDRWTRIERIFAEALDAEPRERVVLVERSCGEDVALRDQILRLLRAHDASGDFLVQLDAGRAAALVLGGSRTSPATIGPYRVRRVLAHGGMGVVYLAEDDRLARLVAVKCAPAWLSADAAARERFTAEARTASVLDHPNVATVYDVGESPDVGPYIAMAYYEGETLAGRIARAPLSVQEALGLAVQIADGLAAAHARGIIHRDVKPSNLLLTAGGTLKILDFGIAKLAGADATRPGVPFGTLAYMSPEQTSGQPLDARSDVWSLGVTLYELLTGHRPFQGEDGVLIHAIRNDEPARLRSLTPAVPGTLARVVERCLQKRAAQRYANAREVLDALRALVRDPDRARPIARHLRQGAAVAFTIASVALAGALLLRARAPSSGVSAPDPSRVMVLPFAAAAADSALVRLGRDLVITLAASLDQLGELRTVDAITVLGRSQDWTAEERLREGLALAGELGAGRVLHGSLVRAPNGVRGDLALYRTADGRREARAVALADLGDVSALTDSIVWSLLQSVWPSERSARTQASALSTRSLPALRAFLEGEQATAENRWREAPDHFARAFQLDSTFWFAYWRYAASMSYRSRPVDPQVLEIVRAHRAEYPELERALVEAEMANGLSEALGILRDATHRFPESWRAWFSLSDHLIHNSMFAGTSVADARAAIERAVALNPMSSTHWGHLFWMTLAEGDTAGGRVALQRLAELGHDSASLRETGLNELAFYRYLHGIEVRSGAPDLALADSLAMPLLAYSGPVDLERIGGGALLYGHPAGELALSQAMLRLPLPASAIAGALRAVPQAWAARGAWDSAMVAMRRYVGRVDEPVALQHAYRLAVVGAWLNALDPDAGTEWRAALERESGRLHPYYVAELHWLDGVRAAARGDPAGIAAAQRRLEPRDSVVAPLLRRSLGALFLAAQGRISEAADSMVALERHRTERYLFRSVADWHPHLTAIDRLAAADWLLRSGRAAEAAPLLRWHEAVQFPAQLTARGDAMLRAIIHFKRARIEAALGRTDAARAHDARFLREYDSATGAHAPLVDSARAALSGGRAAPPS